MSMTMDGMGVATQVSAPGGGPVNGVATAGAAPGATGPGAAMSMTTAVVWTIGGAAAGLFLLGYAFRKGEKSLPPLRVDAMNALNIWFSWLVINGTVKIIAYRYHGHKLAQAYLVVA